MLTLRPLRAVLFDWDGTLLDSYSADASAYLQMFSALSIPWGLQELKAHYSPDWHRVYRAAALPTERWAEADLLWRRAYASERPMLQPGVQPLVHALASRFVVGLVTSGSGWRVRRQLRTFGLDKLFTVQVFGDRAARRKPHPLQLELAMCRLGVPPAACIYVGDAPEDIQMARRAGVASVGIIGNSPVPQRLRASRPDALVPSIPALRSLLLSRLR